jgi:hypothetical protein
MALRHQYTQRGEVIFGERVGCVQTALILGNAMPRACQLSTTLRMSATDISGNVFPWSGEKQTTLQGPLARAARNKGLSFSTLQAAPGINAAKSLSKMKTFL